MATMATAVRQQIIQEIRVPVRQVRTLDNRMGILDHPMAEQIMAEQTMEAIQDLTLARPTLEAHLVAPRMEVPDRDRDPVQALDQDQRVVWVL